MKSKKNIQQCHHRSKIVENSQNPGGYGPKSTHQKSGFSWTNSKSTFGCFSVYIWSSEPNQDSQSDSTSSYYQDITRATRVFLVDIRAILRSLSRPHLRRIFTSGVPCHNSEMSVRDRDRSWDTRHPTKTGFWHHILSEITGDALIQCLRHVTCNEPSFAEIGQKLTSVDQKTSSIVVLSFSDKDLFISLIFLNHLMVKGGFREKWDCR